jgi:hypothetical protein
MRQLPKTSNLKPITYPLFFPHPQEQLPQSQPQADLPCRRLRASRHTASPTATAMAAISTMSKAFMV